MLSRTVSGAVKLWNERFRLSHLKDIVKFSCSCEALQWGAVITVYPPLPRVFRKHQFPPEIIAYAARFYHDVPAAFERSKNAQPNGWDYQISWRDLYGMLLGQAV